MTDFMHEVERLVESISPKSPGKSLSRAPGAPRHLQVTRT